MSVVRKIQYKLGQEDEGRRIRQVLRRKGYSRQNMIELKKTPGCVLLDGQPEYFPEKVHAGQVLTILIKEEKSSDIFPVPLNFGILYEDEDILVVNKPAGMPTHPSAKNTDNTLANALAFYYSRQDRPFVFRCCNRLDRDTSGVTVIAKHHVSASILSDMSIRHEVCREYNAIVKGHVLPTYGRIDIPLGRKPGSIIERMVDPENGERAVTHYRTEKCCGDYTLLSLILETGRTHQIRIHLKAIGYPLIGDYLYNPDMEQISRQALHARRLSFRHPVSGKAMSFEAPIPEDMMKVLLAGSQDRS